MRYDDIIAGLADGINPDTITELTIPKEINGVRTRFIKANAFKELKNLKSIVIESEALTDGIGISAFEGCQSLEKVTIHSTDMKQILGSAFRECKKLTHVSFANGLKEIGEFAFYNCTSLNEVILPDSVTALGKSAFAGCINVSKLHIPVNNTLNKLNESVFENFEKCEELVIPETIIEIGNRAFSGWKQLETLHIPNSVVKIGMRSFGGLSELRTLILPDSVMSVGTYAFTRCIKLKNVTWSTSAPIISTNCFANCYNLKTIILPNTVTTIDSSAFRISDNIMNAGLEKIKIPASVVKIGDSAFAGCSLRDVEFENANNIKTWPTNNMTAFGSQSLPVHLYQTEKGYFVSFKDVGIKRYADVMIAGDSKDKFEKVEAGVFKVKGDVIPTTITYAYNLVENQNASQISGVGISFINTIAYTTIFKDEKGEIIDTYYTLEDKEVAFPNVPDKEGHTTVWDDGTIDGVQREFNLSYKKFPLLSSPVNVTIAEASLHQFNPNDYFIFYDADGKKLDNVKFEGSVDVEKPSLYTLEYKAVDQWGGKTQGKCYITVRSLPVLVGEKSVAIEKGTTFNPNDHFKFKDAEGQLIENVIFEGIVDINTPNTYSLSYQVEDTQGYTLKGTVTVVVKEKQTHQEPIINPDPSPDPTPNIPEIVVQPEQTVKTGDSHAAMMYLVMILGSLICMQIIVCGKKKQ